jgi:hypothetical protein
MAVSIAAAAARITFFTPRADAEPFVRVAAQARCTRVLSVGN